MIESLSSLSPQSPRYSLLLFALRFCVDAVERHFSPSHPVDILGDFLRDSSQAQVGRSADVWSSDHVVGEDRIGRVKRFVPENVKTSAGDAAFLEGCQQGVVVEHRAPSDIDDKRLGFHAGELSLTEQTARLIIEWRRDDDKIRLMQYLRQGLLSAMKIHRYFSGFRPAPRHGENLHLKAGEPLCDFLANAAIADDSSGATLQRHSHRCAQHSLSQAFLRTWILAGQSEHE